MAWGDAWGSKPWNHHHEMAKAFFEGRERSRGVAYVADYGRYMVYRLHGREIARFTPESKIPDIVADKLRGYHLVDGQHYFSTMEFRCYRADKAEARHLQALGVEAHWQYGGNPFLAFDVDVSSAGWLTIEKCKALPKWDRPVKTRAREPFINLTLPLFT